MSNLTTALALIMAIETPNMDSAAIGDLHLPEARRAHGRMQGRITLINDLRRWDHNQINWTTDDLHNPELDVLLAYRWLLVQCGSKASVSVYCRTWNGGKRGRNSDQAWTYYRKAKAAAIFRREHFERCMEETKRRMK